jgi:hypothetical protein
MKKSKIATAEKPAPKVKTEQPVTTVATEAKPKKPDSAKKSSNKPTVLTPKPVPKAKAGGQPPASVASEAKPETAKLTQKPTKKTQAVASKPAPKVKTERPVKTIVTEEKPKKPTDQKTSIKPKAVTPKPMPEVKAEQSVLSVAQEAKPKKASPSQKFPKKAKVAAPKAVVSTVKITTPELVELPSYSVWPNWVEKGANLLQNLLGGFGNKKK